MKTLILISAIFLLAIALGIALFLSSYPVSAEEESQLYDWLTLRILKIL